MLPVAAPTGLRERARTARATVVGLTLAAFLVACSASAPSPGRDGAGPRPPASAAASTTAGPTRPREAPTTTSTSTTTTSTSVASIPSGTGPLAGVPAVPTGPATALVDRLRVAGADTAAADYRRDAFGEGWDYDPESGCNTRERVLIEESRTPPTMGERCKPLAGDWVSAYDGVATRDPADLEIDHLVPLSDAWRSGAARWTPARREAFANDLDDPATLAAVTTRANRSKGDSAPHEWLPPESAARCTYAADWVRVKARWDLAVAPAEKATLVQVLGGC